MRKTKDESLINNIFAVATGGEISDLSESVRKPGNVCLCDGDTAAIFPSLGFCTYGINLASIGKGGGASTKKSIRSAFEVMFCESDALIVQGGILAENKRVLAMVPHTLGYTLSDVDGGYLYEVTVANWARDYGIENACNRMRAAGFEEKSTLLENHAKSAGLI